MAGSPEGLKAALDGRIPAAVVEGDAAAVERFE
jgi:hypothetical protein